jgi:hypothetical protein
VVNAGFGTLVIVASIPVIALAVAIRYLFKK